jgi:hypothetical protein
VLGRLVKFVLLTRFSKPLLAFMALMLAYYLILGHFAAAAGSSPFISMIPYYGTGFTAFVFAVMTLGGGVVVMKSDRDYLFTLPLDKGDLALSLYIAQFVASGIMVFLMFGLFSSVLVVGVANSFLIPLDMVALALCVTSLSVISNVLRTPWRLLVGVLLTLWALSALLGFPFSPASIFTGDVIYGSVAMLALTSVATVAALRELSHVELGTMRNMIRATSPEVKNIRTFAAMTPLRAILSLNFYTFGFATQMNMGGASRYQSGGARLSRVVLVASALALVYGCFVLTSPLEAPVGNAVVSLLPTFAMFAAFFSSQMGMANERLWLALTSMEPSLYFRHISMAKALSFAVALSPFVVVNLALSFLGMGGALASVVPLLITIPCSTVVLLYWSSWAYPIQIREEVPMMPSQFNLRQMTSVVPFIVFLAAAEGSAISIPAAVVVAVVSMALTLYLLYNRGAWDRLAEKLVENGFV